MIPYTPLTCYRSTPVPARMCKGLNLNGFLTVWVWLCGKQFKGYQMKGDRKSERFAGVTDCQSVSGTFLNCVRNTAGARLQ
jgi:hypothetical protein